ncbi:MAG: aldehyde dehydrogenase family protein [Phycisphaerales bacterium]|nr:aldehyde dehydrogenase family protein [Phycisphaerales bacterium]
MPIAIQTTPMTDPYPFYLAGQPVQSTLHMVVTDKFTGKSAYRVSRADRATVERAIAVATNSAEPLRTFPAHKKLAALQHVVDRLRQRAEEFAQVMCIEAGKPIRDARTEVTRALDTFHIAAEESVRNHGEQLSLDISPRAEGYQGIVKRIPLGPCSFITPFNFPLNLVAHKVAPAIAIGCPFVLKPAPTTPVTAIMLAQILAETDLPPGSFSVLPSEVDDAAPMIEDDRIKLLSFTGSAAVGWMLKSKAGKKKVVLELGGNAACIVDRDVDLQAASQRITFGAFYQSGQSCISVQRLIAHQEIYQDLKALLIEQATKLKAGDPRDESTFLGPLITEKDVQRIDQWVQESVKRGARVLCGGRRPPSTSGPFYEATIVENVPSDVKLSCEEAFGPVMTIQPFARFAEACEIANQSRYGLQAGVFTNTFSHALHAFDALQVGGVIINDVPSMRIDSMPYGGVKDSGLGREGVRYAMLEMSELRLMAYKRPGP